ncbi:MAG: GIY-YIG nuclease family protein [Lewinellaceae bacterium]|nr:GIY-YIG nuclease family protein [Lewinellaceae bacterium]
MHFFYVLYSLKDGRLYKGYTSELGQRFIKHNAGGSTSTKHRRPLVLIHLEAFVTKAEALNREKWSKSLEGGAALREMLVEKNILLPDNSLSRVSAG